MHALRHSSTCTYAHAAFPVSSRYARLYQQGVQVAWRLLWIRMQSVIGIQACLLSTPEPGYTSWKCHILWLGFCRSTTSKQHAFELCFYR